MPLSIFVFIESSHRSWASQLWFRVKPVLDENSLSFSPMLFPYHEYEKPIFQTAVRTEYSRFEFGHLLKLYRKVRQSDLFIYVQSHQTPEKLKFHLLNYAMKCNTDTLIVTGKHVRTMTSINDIYTAFDEADEETWEQVAQQIEMWRQQSISEPIEIDDRENRYIETRRRERLFGLILTELIDTHYRNDIDPKLEILADRLDYEHSIFLELLDGDYPIDILEDDFFDILENILHIQVTRLRRLCDPIPRHVDLDNLWIQALSDD